MRRVVSQKFPDEPVVAEPLDLGRFIRAARTQSGLTLEDAALAAGIAKQTMQNIETKPGIVSFSLILDVARALGVSLFAVPSGIEERARRAIRNQQSLIPK